MKPVLITMGDPAGIGSEIIAKAFIQAPQDTADCVVVGDVEVMRRAIRLQQQGGAGRSLALAEFSSLADVQAVPPGAMALVQACELTQLPAWGQVSAAAGRASAQCIETAARAVLAGQACAMVTAPIHKEALSAAGERWSHFPGHTEMLQAEAAAFMGTTTAALPVRMMLANPELKTVLVSIHVSLRQAIDAVTFDRVLETIEISHTALSRALGRAARIAVAGLNPHAGENGLFGREELDVIVPAVAAARARGLDVHGPLAPDTVFMRARGRSGHPGEFDVVVAMYHDQGLIPVKYLGVEQGVNVTLGLPLVRTSPDHGTAFDIAGTGKADPSSLIAALRMARDLAA
jgi:4-hydroxythreonine-4-phosphate dehydrogenase